jgi:dTDP-4-dehydrorhamnose reductase
VVAAAPGRGFEVAALDEKQLDLVARAEIRPALEAAGFDVLVNCAAYTRVDDAETYAGTAFAINAYAVEELATVCRDLGRRLVHVSTDYVFDGETDRPYPVDAAPGPLSVYGASKLVGEVLARRAHPDGTLVVRTSSLFGLAGVPAGGNFIETMIRVGGGQTGSDHPAPLALTRGGRHLSEWPAGLLRNTHRAAGSGS